MTLQGYRARGVPDVEFTPGGVSLTSREGSFPLRGRHLTDDHYQPSMDYHSYNGPMTDHNRRASTQIFQPRHSMNTLDMPQGNSKGGSSISRILKRSRSYRTDKRKTDVSGSMKSFDSLHSTQRFRSGTPRMPEEMKKGFEQERKRKILAAFEKQHQKQMEWTSFNDHNASRNSDLNSEVSFNSHINMSVKKKKLSEQELPHNVFIASGLMLLMLAVIRLMFTHWHTYYYGFWSAAPPLFLGIVGLIHRTEYLVVWKNFLYIILGLITSLVTMVTGYLSIKMIYMLCVNLINLLNLNMILLIFPFTMIIEPDIDVGVSIEVKVYVTLVIDICILLLSMVNMYAMTSILYAINNHWDASLMSTGTCNHRGTPRVFNPLQLISLGQSTVFIGTVIYVVQVSGVQTYYSSLWTGLFIIFAAFMSTFHLKRPDLNSLGIFSIFCQLIALVAIAISMVFIAKGLVEDSDVIYRDKKSSTRRWQTVVAMVAGAFYLLELISDVVYISGVLFRAVKRIRTWQHKQQYQQEI